MHPAAQAKSSQSISSKTKPAAAQAHRSHKVSTTTSPTTPTKVSHGATSKLSAATAPDGVRPPP